jgi:3-hydroxyisobutyrate dehydrogenase-like beta-hydroxyacid dehydrogenase
MASMAQPTIAFIGFGEVGQTFARDFVARGITSIRAYDIRFADASGAVLEAAARALGVTRHGTLAEALTMANIVFSSVTATAAETVAKDAAQHVEQGQLFVDVNSAAPSTKQRAAAVIEAAGGRYLEAAVMAPVLKPGLHVPILVGGPHAAGEAPRLNGLGMNLTAVSDVFGRASAMKLSRSIIIKGLEALLVDCSAAVEAAGVRDEVFASLAETFPSIDWHALADTMKERVATHGIRRAEEMREAGEMLAALGLNPALALAVADAQQRGARSSRGRKP